MCGMDTEKTQANAENVAPKREQAEQETNTEQTKKAEKLFTQAEVDEIIKKRLDRVKRGEDLAERMNNIEKRESVLSELEAKFKEDREAFEREQRKDGAIKKLHEQGLPESYIRFVDCTSDASIEDCIQALKADFKPSVGFKIGGPGQSNKERCAPTPREIFGLS